MLTVQRLNSPKLSIAPGRLAADRDALALSRASTMERTDLPPNNTARMGPNAPVEEADDESAASALLAFLSAARSEVVNPEDESPPSLDPNPATTHDDCVEDEEVEDKPTVKSTHWSGIERPPPLVAVDNDEDYEARRVRVNHMRRCNEDMRILMLGWHVVDVDTSGVKSSQKVYEHPKHGRVMSKKEIFKIHKGERIDFSTSQAANVSTHVRSARASSDPAAPADFVDVSPRASSESGGDSPHADTSWMPTDASGCVVAPLKPPKLHRGKGKGLAHTKGASKAAAAAAAATADAKGEAKGGRAPRQTPVPATERRSVPAASATAETAAHPLAPPAEPPVAVATVAAFTTAPVAPEADVAIADAPPASMISSPTVETPPAAPATGHISMAAGQISVHRSNGSSLSISRLPSAAGTIRMRLPSRPPSTEPGLAPSPAVASMAPPEMRFASAQPSTFDGGHSVTMKLAGWKRPFDDTPTPMAPRIPLMTCDEPLPMDPALLIKGDAPGESDDKELSPHTCGKRLQIDRPWPLTSPPAVV